jgi:hypothetical protein
MRKSLLLAATAAVAAMVLPAASASAVVRPAAPGVANATPDVLTQGAVAGTNTGAKDLMQAGLQKGTPLTFVWSLSGLTVTISCTKSYATIRSKINPVAPGTATLSLNKLTATACTATASQSGLISGVQSVTFTTVDPLTISDATGDPVTVTGAPVVTFTVNSVVGAVTCGYAASGLSSAFTDTGSAMAFTNQAFTTLQAGSNSLCPTTGGTFAATYGPLKDLTVTGHPAVFVN